MNRQELGKIIDGMEASIQKTNNQRGLLRNTIPFFFTALEYRLDAKGETPPRFEIGGVDRKTGQISKNKYAYFGPGEMHFTVRIWLRRGQSDERWYADIRMSVSYSDRPSEFVFTTLANKKKCVIPKMYEMKADQFLPVVDLLPELVQAEALRQVHRY